MITNLMMSGGIGDYVHYAARFPAFCETRGIAPHDVRIIVEATNPRNVRSYFELMFGGAQIEFAPPGIHWIFSYAVLDVRSERDRSRRPAYRFAQERFGEIAEDWFLPFSCAPHELRLDALTPLLERARERTPPVGGAFALVSMRDKGAGWWPSSTACDAVQGATRLPLVVAGNKDELGDWPNAFTFESALDALCGSLRARMFVGTDTGLATVRELAHLPNVYCVESFWFTDVLEPLGYWPPALADHTTSVIACSLDEMVAGVRALDAR